MRAKADAGKVPTLIGKVRWHLDALLDEAGSGHSFEVRLIQCQD
jgi:hypothetical protein